MLKVNNKGTRRTPLAWSDVVSVNFGHVIVGWDSIV